VLAATSLALFVSMHQAQAGTYRTTDECNNFTSPANGWAYYPCQSLDGPWEHLAAWGSSTWSFDCASTALSNPISVGYSGDFQSGISVVGFPDSIWANPFRVTTGTVTMTNWDISKGWVQPIAGCAATIGQSDATPNNAMRLTGSAGKPKPRLYLTGRSRAANADGTFTLYENVPLASRVETVRAVGCPKGTHRIRFSSRIGYYTKRPPATVEGEETQSFTRLSGKRIKVTSRIADMPGGDDMNALAAKGLVVEHVSVTCEDNARAKTERRAPRTH
jgi:hypothetical protein